ncbi:MAG: hypothetical protein L6R39_005538, partial [Caloplaca ligustica]
QATTNTIHNGSDTHQQPTVSQMPGQQQQRLVGATASAQSASQNLHPPAATNPPTNPHPGPQYQPLPPQYHHAAVQHPRAQLPQQQTSQPNARVFKLQFDARRIICCSQDPKIVGWDFANGDERIIECAKFFATPQ